mmetsp:Transcript_13758/g.44035  ORF Transcript_13758/g.44035 Transcript_13758/m.44035 type:complete len:283 (-) Transcript_13758:1071-1919(-)
MSTILALTKASPVRLIAAHVPLIQGPKMGTGISRHRAEHGHGAAENTAQGAVLGCEAVLEVCVLAEPTLATDLVRRKFQLQQLDHDHLIRVQLVARGSEHIGGQVGARILEDHAKSVRRLVLRVLGSLCHRVHDVQAAHAVLLVRQRVRLRTAVCSDRLQHRVLPSGCPHRRPRQSIGQSVQLDLISPLVHGELVPLVGVVVRERRSKEVHTGDESPGQAVVAVVEHARQRRVEQLSAEGAEAQVGVAGVFYHAARGREQELAEVESDVGVQQPQLAGGLNV